MTKFFEVVNFKDYNDLHNLHSLHKEYEQETKDNLKKSYRTFQK